MEAKAGAVAAQALHVERGYATGAFHPEHLLHAAGLAWSAYLRS